MINPLQQIYKLPHIGLVFALIYAFNFSLNGVFVKLLKDMDAITIMTYRSMVSLILLLPFIIVKRPILLPEKGKKLLLTRSILSCTTYTVLFVAYRFVSFADATAISLTAPALTVIMERLALKEPMGKFHWLAVFLSLAGVLLVTRPSYIFSGTTIDGKMGIGLGLAAFAALFIASSTVIVRQLKHVNRLTLHLFYFGISVIVLVPITTVLQVWKLPSTPVEWILVLSIGAVGLLNQYFFCTALKLESAGAVNLITTTQVIFTYMWELLAFRATPFLENYIGAALISAAAITIALVKIYKSKKISCIKRCVT